MDTDEYIFNTRWIRLRWNDIIAVGIAFDPDTLVFGIYLGAVSLYVGSNLEA